MITVATEQHEDGEFPIEITMTSARGDLIRRIVKNATGEVVREWTYEYDSKGRCLCGVVMDGEHKIRAVIENSYTESGTLLESVEREAVFNVELWRVSYTLDDQFRIERVDYFERGLKIGFSIPDNPDDEFSLNRYFDAHPNQTSHIISSSLY